MKNRTLSFGLIFLMTAGVSFSKENDFENKMAGFLKNAQATIGDQDHHKSDFWMARYLGQICSTNGKTKRSERDLYPLYDKRWDLSHAMAFVSGLYSNDFLSFFLENPDCMWWGPDDNIRKDMSFAVQSNTDGKYVTQIWMHPHFQDWSIIGAKEGRKEITTAVVPMGDANPKPYIRLGRIVKKNGTDDIEEWEPVYLDLPEGVLVQYVWPVEFRDLDGDGIPEIWVRYNMGLADGFTQILNIYKLENNHKVRLLKSFTGDIEGMARLLPNGKILVGHSMTAKNAGHLGYELTQLETWEYQKGNFIKTTTKTVPNILWSDAWEKYYFDKDK